MLSNTYTITKKFIRNLYSVSFFSSWILALFLFFCLIRSTYVILSPDFPFAQKIVEPVMFSGIFLANYYYLVVSATRRYLKKLREEFKEKNVDITIFFREEEIYAGMTTVSYYAIRECLLSKNVFIIKTQAKRFLYMPCDTFQNGSAKQACSLIKSINPAIKIRRAYTNIGISLAASGVAIAALFTIWFLAM